MKWLLIALCFVIVSCSHSIHQVHMSDFDPHGSIQDNIIEASSEQFVVMGFAFDTDYVNQAYGQMQAQCDGNIKGITTQYSTSHGFFSWTNKILMKGVCIE